MQQPFGIDTGTPPHPFWQHSWPLVHTVGQVRPPASKYVGGPASGGGVVVEAGGVGVASFFPASTPPTTSPPHDTISAAHRYRSTLRWSSFRLPVASACAVCCGVLWDLLKRHRAASIALLAVVAVLVRVGLIPLFAGLGYEYALASGLVVPSVAAVWTAIVAVAEREKPPIDVVLRGMGRGAALALVAIAIGLLHGLRVGTCDLWAGSPGSCSGLGLERSWAARGEGCRPCSRALAVGRASSGSSSHSQRRCSASS